MPRRLSVHISSFFVPVLLLICTKPVFGEEGFNLGPLFYMERDKTQGSQEIYALGPFITSKREKESTEFGFRPLFYLLEDGKRDSTQFDFLYPIATYDRREEDRSFQFLFYLLSYHSNLKPSGFREREFTLFPLIFTKRAEKEEDSYFALFPIYGDLKDKFARDEIDFFLFPLFLRTRSGEATNYSLLWPFFGYYTGGGQEGFRLWPLFGYKKKVGVFDEKFALWPIYISRRQVAYGKERRSFMIFPFYSTVESPERTQSTYLWPLFNRLLDRERGIERWDVPWPLINLTRGTKKENRVFPFYASEVDGNDEEGFFLWPLYRYYKVTLQDYVRTRKTVLLFLYSDIREKSTIEGGMDRRRIDAWPLFTYRRDAEGNRSLHLLSILEPLLSGNEGIERSYSPIWRLYEWKGYRDGRSVSSLLWNTYRMERSKEGIMVDFRPIIPVFSYRNWNGGSKIYFLGGLFGYRSDSHKKTIKLFFFPVDISSKDEASEEGGLKR
ncbi:MAG TPA: hypothetical protein VNK81_03570 [Thermodesulfobacteriota bacterium]|nr:hypothetical protein [Thermodesulfobacteriota bacterium]